MEWLLDFSSMDLAFIGSSLSSSLSAFGRHQTEPRACYRRSPSSSGSFQPMVRSQPLEEIDGVRKEKERLTAACKRICPAVTVSGLQLDRRWTGVWHRWSCYSSCVQRSLAKRDQECCKPKARTSNTYSCSISIPVRYQGCLQLED